MDVPFHKLEKYILGRFETSFSLFFIFALLPTILIVVRKQQARRKKKGGGYYGHFAGQIILTHVRLYCKIHYTLFNEQYQGGLESVRAFSKQGLVPEIPSPHLYTVQ